MRIKGDPRERFHAKYIVNPETGCWEWQARINRTGYGRFKVGRREYAAHRIAYELLVDRIPEGLDIDHLCRVRHCVNPEHLEPVTRRENIRRGLTGHNSNNHNARKTHCKRGHPFDTANTAKLSGGRRGCLACRRAYRKTYRMQAA